MPAEPNQQSFARLAISGMPSLTDRMSHGGVYALVAELPPARFPLLASCLASALKDKLPVTVITVGAPESLLERFRTLGIPSLNDALLKQQLTVFSVRENFAKNMFRFGTDYFVRELNHFGIPKGGLLIFDQADDLLSLHDISLALEQMNTLSSWFESRKTTALLALTRAPSGSQALGTLHGLMDQLSGIARLSGEREGLELNFDYWQSPEGSLAAKRYPIATQDSGSYRVGAISLPQNTQNTLPPESTDDDQPHYFYMDTDLSGLAKSLSGVWRYVDSLVGMLHATRGLRSPTAILTFERKTELRPLAEAVHTLRLSLGRRARIIIREKEASLRYQNEALLLRLGTSLVVHRDVLPSRIPLLLESLNGQVFDRDVDINFESALASAMPSGLRGYLSVNRFAKEVENIVERSAVLSIPCALIVGTPIRPQTTADILCGATMSRPGDLITADDKQCYVFLSGCPESSILMATERVLGKTLRDVFSETRFVVPAHELRAELNALLKLASKGNLPDYSEVIAQAARPAVSQEPAPTPEPTPAPAVDNKQPTVMASPASMPSAMPATAVVAEDELLPSTSMRSPEPTIINTPAKPIDTPVSATETSALEDLTVQPEVTEKVSENRLSDRSTKPRISSPLFGKSAIPRASRAEREGNR